MKIITAKEFDKIFDFPTWMVKKLDEEAQHTGVSRQAIIKTWLADKIMQNEHHKVAI